MLACVEAMTIKDAAERLGVTPQRVSQMLASGLLHGPSTAHGRRAAPNALRVFTASLDQALAARAADARDHLHRDSSRRVSDDDVMRLKVALDVARDQIARQRRQNERLTRLLADAVEAIRDEQALAQEMDKITEAYSTIATTHLASDSPPHD